MKQYRIVAEGLYYYVEVGSPISCYWVGTSPPIQWVRSSRFFTSLEAQQYISFLRSTEGSSTSFNRGYDFRN